MAAVPHLTLREPSGLEAWHQSLAARNIVPVTFAWDEDADRPNYFRWIVDDHQYLVMRQRRTPMLLSLVRMPKDMVDVAAAAYAIEEERDVTFMDVKFLGNVGMVLFSKDNFAAISRTPDEVLDQLLALAHASDVK